MFLVTCSSPIAISLLGLLGKRESGYAPTRIDALTPNDPQEEILTITMSHAQNFIFEALAEFEFNIISPPPNTTTPQAALKAR